MTERTPDKPRYVAGALGPTSRTASISPDVNDPGARNVTYDELVDGLPGAGRRAWSTAAPTSCSSRRSSTRSTPRRRSSRVETLFEERGRRWPVMISGTITDASGRTLSGSGHRGVLALGAARAARCWSASTARSAPRRCGPTSPRWRASPTPSCPAIRTPACPTPSASTTRRPTRPPRSSRSSPTAASSTWSAAAAARRRRTSPRSPARVEGKTPRDAGRGRRRPCGCPVSSR